MDGRWFAAALAALLAGSAAAQTQTLRYKFPKGQTLKYHMETRSSHEETGGEGQKVVVIATTKLDYRWTILGTDETGAGEIAQTFERIQFEAIGGPNGAVKFDSKDPPAGEDKTGFRKFVGVEFRFAMTPEGVLQTVRAPDGWDDGSPKDAPKTDAKDAPPAKEGKAKAPAPPAALVGVIDSGLVPLPKAAVRTGDRWAQPPAQTMVNAGVRLVVNIEDTLAGIEEHAGGKVAKIARKPTLELKVGKNNLGLTGKIVEQSAAATVLFDPAAGRLVKADLTQRYALEFSAKGKAARSATDTETNLRLLP